jgi:hypothetical protein
MIVTEQEYDRWPSEFWDELARQSPKRQTCENCAYYGCCDDLHNCGGRYWEEAEDGE